MVNRIFCTLLCLSIFFHTNAQKTKQSREDQWVDSVFATLSEESMVGQLFMIAAYSNGDAKHQRQITDNIRDHELGGLIFMQGGPERQVHLTNKYQAASKLPLLVGMDLEWGLTMRLDSTIRYPRQMALGAIQEPDLITEMGEEIGRQMNVLGAHINFAPVADINNNPANPVIGTRSFGEDKRRVAQGARAYAKGLENAGIIAVAKHFPGHGDTDKDSHKTLPALPHNADRIDSLEAYPFKQLISDNVAGIMTAHLQVDALDDTYPASLSSKITTDYLRKKLGYNGLIFTDALNMKAVSEKYSDGQAELLAFKAGADVLLFSTDVAVAKSKILNALERDRKLKKQLEASVRRILHAKFKAGLHVSVRLSTDNVLLRLNQPTADALSNTLFEKSVTALKNDNGNLPIRQLDNQSYALLSFGSYPYFAHALNQYLEMPVINGYQSAESVRTQLENVDVVIVAVGGGDRDMSEIQRMLTSLEETHRVITSYFGNPYAASALTGLKTLLLCYDDAPQSQFSSAGVIFGALEANGRLPVTINPAMPVGAGINVKPIGRLGYALPEMQEMDSRTLSRIDALAQEAIQNKATPGCQVLVARKGKVVYQKSFGYHTYDSLVPVSEQTIYDLASITKVMASTQALMFLSERGLVDLDKKISVYLPELKGTNKEHMILRDILSHQAGLWAYLPFWRQTMKKNSFLPEYYDDEPSQEYSLKVTDELYARPAVKDSIWQWVKESKLRKKKDHEPYGYKYSDIGYYLIQRMMETMMNQSIADFMAQNFYEPLGMNATGYQPLERFPVSRIAPTENDRFFRKSLVVGRVHDQGAALFDGVAGHAGLFGTANDLGKNLQMLLNGGTYGGQRYFDRETIVEFTSKQYEKNRRGAGWDKPLMGEWYGPTAEYASEQTFGHTGFTGTAVWVDPEYDLIYVFLANRIYPDASNSKLLSSNIRTRIQEVIYKAIHTFESVHLN